MNLTNEQVLGIVRHVLTALGGILVTLGKMNDGQVQQIIGVAMVIVPMVWSVVSKNRGGTPPDPKGDMAMKKAVEAACFVAALCVAAVMTGCSTTAQDVEMAKVAAGTASNYYSQANTAPLIHAVGTNVTLTISGATELTLSTPTIPKSIYPRDEGTIETIISGVKDIAPWAVAGYVGGKLAGAPKTVAPEVVRPEVVTVPAQ